jgi:hypothetical protein
MKRKSFNWSLTIVMMVLIVVCIDMNLNGFKNTNNAKDELLIVDILTAASIIVFISMALIKSRKKK